MRALGFDVKTEDQLEEALKAARAHTESFTILDVHLDPADRSLALRGCPMRLVRG